MKKLLIAFSIIWLNQCGGGSDGPTEPQEPAPVANFTATPTTLIQGQAVTFTSTSTGTITSYAWNVDDNPVIEGTTATYTHNYTDFGTYSVTLTVTGPGGSNSKTIADMISVATAAPTPTTSTSHTVQEDGSTTINLTATDPNGQAVTFAITSDPTNGIATLVNSANGTDITYTPNANFFGTDSFSYTASNETYTSEPATITIVVEGEDDEPTTNDITASTNEDVSVELSLDASEFDGDSISFSVISQPSNGILGDINDNKVEYTPNPDWNGTDTFTFEATDERILFDKQNIATATITVNPVNDPPVTDNQSASTDEDNAVDITLTSNDVEEDNISYSIVSDTSNGSSVLSGVIVTYTPSSDWNGTDTLSFKANDGMDDSNTSTLTITVNGINDAPIANNVTTQMDENKVGGRYQPVTVTLNASDVDGDNLTYALVAGPANGSVGDISNNEIIYAPNQDFNGTDTFTYKANDGVEDSNEATVTVTINPVDDPPTTENMSVETDEDVALEISFPATDVDGESLSYSIEDGVSNGTLELANNIVNYTPDLNWSGNVSFTYKANDGISDSNISTVTINVNAVNDPPTSEDTAAETNEDSPTSLGLNAQDIEGPLNDQFFYSIVTQPANGTASVASTAPNNTCEYTPNENFYGTDTFTFRASDGTDDGNIATVTVTVTPVDDFPEAQDVSASVDEDNSVVFTLPVVDIDGGPTYNYQIVIDQQPSSGSVTISDEQANYTPNLNFYGTDIFTFKSVLDNGNSFDARATITVNPINDDPTLVIGEIEGRENTVLEITPDATDVDGDPITFSIVKNPTNGTASIDGTKIIFTPNTGFVGVDSLFVTVSDGTTTTESQKVLLPIDWGSRDWPFIHHYSGALSSIDTRPHNWEGKMFDYDGNGLADMIGFTYQVYIAEEIPNYEDLNEYNRTHTIDVLSSIPSEIIGDDPTYWQAGTAEFGHINNDNIIDMFISIQREYCANWPNCDLDTGPSVIGISNGVGYDWQLVNEEIKFWQDGNIEFADIDNDGDVDIIAQDNQAYKVEKDYLIVFKNDGNNNFTEQRIQLDQQVSLEEFRVKDIDKDGYNDIIGFGGGGTGFLHILYGTSQWDKFDYFELDFGAQESDGFYDVTIVDLENDDSYEILTLRVVSAGFPELILEKHLFRSNGSRAYQMDETTQFSGTVYGQVGPIPKTQAWDFDDDGDKDIFIHYFNEYRPDVKYADPGPTGDDGTGCCYCWHRDFDSQANGTLNNGYFWKNENGALVKTYFNAREDKCTFDSFYGFEGIFSED
tara:strand:+ start:635 stop:4471 length:3837 start_codon:yes stop_codon:yes gene_type:complete